MLLVFYFVFSLYMMIKNFIGKGEDMLGNCFIGKFFKVIVFVYSLVFGNVVEMLYWKMR